jgi:hypothetical protein
VIGAAEVDVDGNVNSSLVDGEPLVGPGGAPDIAACANEVMVLTRADPRRLVRKVQYLTSLGQRVRTIVTEACVFERSGPGEPWLVREVVPARAALLKDVLAAGFRFVMPGPPPSAPTPTTEELTILAHLRVANDRPRAAKGLPHG